MMLPSRLRVLRHTITAATLTCLIASNASAQYFGRNKVQYEDFDFEILKTEHFDIYFYPEEREGVDIAARLSERWLARLERAGVPAGKIKSVGEALDSEHLLARGAIVTVNHPTAGRMRMVGPPIRLHGTPAEAATPAPLLGEHTDEVLTKMLGYSSDAVAELRAGGVV